MQHRVRSFLQRALRRVIRPLFNQLLDASWIHANSYVFSKLYPLVDLNGGMFSGKQAHRSLDPVSAFRCRRCAFRPLSLSPRKGRQSQLPLKSLPVFTSLSTALPSRHTPFECAPDVTLWILLIFRILHLPTMCFLEHFTEAPRDNHPRGHHCQR